MPKPRQQRGRRSKRKLEDDPEDAVPEQSDNKRRKSSDDNGEQDYLPLDVQDDGSTHANDYSAQTENAFFGVLDEQEQEYFKQADQMLENDSFENPEERTLFLENVFREADGKELKIAQSQSCSRLMERLIAQASAQQLKNLFQKLSGNFIHLLTHRFASHCCEALFTRAAPIVSQELRTSERKEKMTEENSDGVYVTMENLFLHGFAELEGNLGYLITDQYASHALRILLLVFSGDPITTDAMKSLLRSKKKENVVISGLEQKEIKNEPDSKPRTVPKSFSEALEKLIAESVSGLDTDKLRALSTHPIANPTLQLLLKLEMTHYGKQRAKDESSIIRTLLPDDPFTPDCESASFISGLVYDPVGAHLVERIIELAPAKLFKSLYNTFFKERLVSYARNEIATFIDCRIIERLGYDDLLEAHETFIPLISPLLDKSWTSLVRTLIERCTIRNIDTQAIAAQIDQTWRTSDRFDIERMLWVDKQSQSVDLDGERPPTTNGNTDSNPSSAALLARGLDPFRTRMNILAQAMLIVPGPLSSLIIDSLLELTPEALMHMARDHVTTRTLQQALTTKNASMIQRRKFIQRFYGNIGEMALDKSASHLVDCIWEGTHGLAHLRERIAEELMENEAALRDVPCGRAVWKNWKMDLYKRRRLDWIKQSKRKASNDGFQSFAELDANNGKERKKTPLEMARERYAQGKAKSEKKLKRSSSNKRDGGSAPETAASAS